MAEPRAALLAGLRRILRLHRRALPAVHRALGDRVAVDELRAMGRGSSTTAAQWAAFTAEWRAYEAALAGHAPLPEPSEAALMAQLSDDQRRQLQRLRNETGRLGQGDG